MACFPQNLLVPPTLFPVVQFQVRFTIILVANGIKVKQIMRSKSSFLQHYNIHLTETMK